VPLLIVSDSCYCCQRVRLTACVLTKQKVVLETCFVAWTTMQVEYSTGVCMYVFICFAESAKPP